VSTPFTSQTPQEPDAHWCPHLDQNLGQYHTPEGFYEWHKSIWVYRVDPNNFSPSIFHANCLLTDPFATLEEPLQSSLYFQILFLALATFEQLKGVPFA
jgi:hypothetical protein